MPINSNNPQNPQPAPTGVSPGLGTFASRQNWTPPGTQPVQPGVITPPTTQPTPMPQPNPRPGNGVQPLPLVPENPTNPTPFPVQPRPLYPEPPGSPGTPGAPTAPGGGPPPYNPVPGTTNGNPYAPPSSYSPYNVVTDNLNNLLSNDGTYMTNARQRGLEQAASRGMLNSSIAAGSSQRAALEAAQPILSNIMGLTSQRESQAFSSSEAQRGRQFQAEFASMNAQLQDWMSNNDFNRNFNGQLAMMPIASAADMWSGLMQLAASDPTVFTPDVLAGYQDFFQTGFDEYISRYLQPATTTPPGGT